MKSRLLLTLILGAFLSFLSACSSDDNNPSGSSGNTNGTITATVNGQAWNATIVSKAAKSGPQMVITGDQVAGGRQTKIQINLIGVTTTGTYSLGLMNSGVYIDVPAGTTDPTVFQQATEMAESGSITITELSDARVKATFSMTTNEGTSITNGNLDVKF